MHIIIGVIVVLFIGAGVVGKIRDGEASPILMLGVLAALACIFSLVLSAWIPMLSEVAKWSGAAVVLCIFLGVTKWIFGFGR